MLASDARLAFVLSALFCGGEADVGGDWDDMARLQGGRFAGTRRRW
jgi:hypothetical protein